LNFDHLVESQSPEQGQIEKTEKPNIMSVHDLSSPALHLSNSYHRSEKDCFHLEYLFQLSFPNSITLEQLKELVVENILDSKTQLLEALSFPLNKDILKKLIRIWNEDRLLRKDQSTLKKQNVTHPSCVLTIDYEPEYLNDMPKSEESILIYIHKRDSKKKIFETAIQYYFTIPSSNAEAKLYGDIAKLLGLPQPTESPGAFVLAKFHRYNYGWQAINLATETTSSTQTQPQKSKLSLKDGEIIAVKVTDTSSPDDDFISQRIAIFREPKTKYGTTEDWTYNGSGNSNAKRRAEPQLKIHLDFS